MDVITIESEAFAKIIGKIDGVERKVLDVIREAQYPLDERWLDNQQVCLTLKISKRLLQMYRDNKKLPYSQIHHKIYYKARDIQNFLSKSYKPVNGF